MEETNYYRKPSVLTSDTEHVSSTSPMKNIELDEKGPETIIDQDTPSLEQAHRIPPSTKTYLQKLALFQNADLKQPNRLIGMVTRPLIFLTFPVIFYAGFSYGSNLIVSPDNLRYQFRTRMPLKLCSSGSTSSTAQPPSSSAVNPTTSPPRWSAYPTYHPSSGSSSAAPTQVAWAIGSSSGWRGVTGGSWSRNTGCGCSLYR